MDLGASAKALVADRAAKRIFEALGSGTLVSIGGDVAVAGPTPCGGWPVGIAIDSSTSPESVDQTVAIQGGGLASSSTAVRIWQSNEERVHHIVDPSTGRSSLPFWTLVSVAAVSCVQANAIATASVVWGAHAVARVASHGVAARLVRHDGKVIALGGWPTT